MDNDIRDIYEADVNRFRDDAARADAHELGASKGTDEVFNPRKHKWEDAYPDEPVTDREAYADGWIAYCEDVDEDDNPFEATNLALAGAWEDGWADAEDFYGGEPCHEA